MPNYKVLYTKDVRKKRKVYHDGFLSIDQHPQACLLREDGLTLASGRIPQGHCIDSQSENLSFLDGYLVNCDEECERNEVPAYRETPNACTFAADEESRCKLKTDRSSMAFPKLRSTGRYKVKHLPAQEEKGN